MMPSAFTVSPAVHTTADVPVPSTAPDNEGGDDEPTNLDTDPDDEIAKMAQAKLASPMYTVPSRSTPMLFTCVAKPDDPMFAYVDSE
jgi:hypothetical protein